MTKRAKYDEEQQRRARALVHASAGNKVWSVKKEQSEQKSESELTQKAEPEQQPEQEDKEWQIEDGRDSVTKQQRNRSSCVIT